MTVAHLVNQNYSIIDAYARVDLAKVKDIIWEGIVVMEDDSPIGVLTASDLVKKRHILVVDCLSPKPKVDCKDKLEKVLSLMEQQGYEVLPVYDGNEFFGLISHWSVMHHVYTSYDRQNITIQGVVHDLKSPIHSIKMVVDLLDRQVVREENKQLIDLLRMTCDQAESLIKDILYMGHTFEVAMESTVLSFDSIVSECLMEFRPSLTEKRIALTSQLGFGGLVKGDSAKLKRAVQNIISNSIKFCYNGGHIEVESSVSENRVLFRVTDDGIGVPKEIQGQVFDKFTKAKRVGTNGEHSTGLGLYLCTRILEAHGGGIGMESNGKLGTTVTFTLPVFKKRMDMSKLLIS